MAEMREWPPNLLVGIADASVAVVNAASTVLALLSVLAVRLSSRMGLVVVAAKELVSWASPDVVVESTCARTLVSSTVDVVVDVGTAASMAMAGTDVEEMAASASVSVVATVVEAMAPSTVASAVSTATEELSAAVETVNVAVAEVCAQSDNDCTSGSLPLRRAKRPSGRACAKVKQTPTSVKKGKCILTDVSNWMRDSGDSVRCCQWGCNRLGAWRNQFAVKRA